MLPDKYTDQGAGKLSPRSARKKAVTLANLQMMRKASSFERQTSMQRMVYAARMNAPGER